MPPIIFLDDYFSQNIIMNSVELNFQNCIYKNDYLDQNVGYPIYKKLQNFLDGEEYSNWNNLLVD